MCENTRLHTLVCYPLLAEYIYAHVDGTCRVRTSHTIMLDMFPYTNHFPYCVEEVID